VGFYPISLPKDSASSLSSNSQAGVIERLRTGMQISCMSAICGSVCRGGAQVTRVFSPLTYSRLPLATVRPRSSTKLSVKLIWFSLPPGPNTHDREQRTHSLGHIWT
jgi:hypothetical protein